MMKRSDIKVGQTVYVFGNYRREGLIETEVTKVGTKYLWVKVHGDSINFNLSDLREKRGNRGIGFGYTLYLAKQDYFDELEKDRLYDEIYEKIRHKSNFNLDQLRIIKKILEEEKNDEINI